MKCVSSRWVKIQAGVVLGWVAQRMSVKSF